jgi:actin-related protein
LLLVYFCSHCEALTDATDAKKWKINKVFDPMEPDWDSALLMWEYMFNDLLQVDASAFPVMMTETPDMSVIGREETYEIMFEHFNVPMLYIGNSALMSLYAMGAV